MKKTFSDQPKTSYVSGTLVHTTEKAYLFSVMGNECWFPKSRCTLSEDQTRLAVPRGFRYKTKAVKRGGLI